MRNPPLPLVCETAPPLSRFPLSSTRSNSINIINFNNRKIQHFRDQIEKKLKKTMRTTELAFHLFLKKLTFFFLPPKTFPHPFLPFFLPAAALIRTFHPPWRSRTLSAAFFDFSFSSLPPFFSFLEKTLGGFARKERKHHDFFQPPLLFSFLSLLPPGTLPRTRKQQQRLRTFFSLDAFQLRDL